ncbi:hypothetical protein Trco_003153 [Trichoderma cornu-damae]|uniref:Uncharacterized protein n=1 Tax=Trichoderma cornu-damae TaxID=654480 RepID=A0A9P8QWD4_9HYPO|nr:hypothetical protein Trco_003153 [Trichoderma cornu-damae]
MVTVEVLHSLSVELYCREPDSPTKPHTQMFAPGVSGSCVSHMGSSKSSALRGCASDEQDEYQSGSAS